jgi:hypothetical protein
MITIQETNQIEKGNLGDETSFSFKATAKAFKILSSNLYTNKILAIVRELSCNALDSHIAAHKQDVPFHIHLPSSLDPTFYVEDFGTGLSPDNIKNVYVKFFESTKTESNDFVGALGLGSKSPFSYTQSFQVNSVWNKHEYLYMCFLNSNGIPCISEAGSFETEKENGIKVSFPVETTDIESFKNTASDFFEHWRYTMPVFVNTQLTKSPAPVLIETEDFILYDKPSNSGSRTCSVIQGPVKYPLKISAMNMSLEKYNDIIKASSLVIKFNIGDLDIAPSREELSYDQITIDAIVTKLEKINSSFNEILINYAYEKAISNENPNEGNFDRFKTFIDHLSRIQSVVNFHNSYFSLNLSKLKTYKFGDLDLSNLYINAYSQNHKNNGFIRLIDKSALNLYDIKISFWRIRLNQAVCPDLSFNNVTTYKAYSYSKLKPKYEKLYCARSKTSNKEVIINPDSDKLYNFANGHDTPNSVYEMQQQVIANPDDFEGIIYIPYHQYGKTIVVADTKSKRSLNTKINNVVYQHLGTTALVLICPERVVDSVKESINAENLGFEFKNLSEFDPLKVEKIQSPRAKFVPKIKAYSVANKTKSTVCVLLRSTFYIDGTLGYSVEDIELSNNSIQEEDILETDVIVYANNKESCFKFANNTIYIGDLRSYIEMAFSSGILAENQRVVTINSVRVKPNAKLFSDVVIDFLHNSPLVLSDISEAINIRSIVNNQNTIFNTLKYMFVKNSVGIELQKKVKEYIVSNQLSMLTEFFVANYSDKILEDNKNTNDDNKGGIPYIYGTLLTRLHYVKSLDDVRSKISSIIEEKCEIVLDKLSKIEKQYPMLSYIRLENDDGKQCSTVLDYINLVDKNNQ